MKNQSKKSLEKILSYFKLQVVCKNKTWLGKVFRFAFSNILLLVSFISSSVDFAMKLVMVTVWGTLINKKVSLFLCHYVPKRSLSLSANIMFLTFCNYSASYNDFGILNSENKMSLLELQGSLLSFLEWEHSIITCLPVE